LAHLGDGVKILYVEQHLADHVGHGGHLSFLHAARSDGGVRAGLRWLGTASGLKRNVFLFNRDARVIEAIWESLPVKFRAPTSTSIKWLSVPR